MQKSTEERLADIENGITRLIRIQRYVPRMLIILQRISGAFIESELSITELKMYLESYHRHGDRFLAFMFGAIAAMSLGTSTIALYFATMNSNFIGMFTVCFILFFVLLFFGFREYRREKSEHQEFEQTFAKHQRAIDRIEERLEELTDDLAQIVDEWNELVPDDLVSEPRNGTPRPKDSHDRS